MSVRLLLASSFKGPEHSTNLFHAAVKQVTAMGYTSPQVYAALVGLTTYLLYRWYRHPVCYENPGMTLSSRTYQLQLRSIPAVGSTLPILSYGGAFRFLRDAQQVLQEGCAKVGDLTASIQPAYPR